MQDASMRPQLVNHAERSFAVRLSRAVSVTCNALILAGFLTVIVPGWVAPLVKGQAATKAQAQLEITTVALPAGFEGAAYSGTLSATSTYGSNVTFTWAVAPATPDQLPLGLTLSPNTGMVSGTPGPGTAGGATTARNYSVRFSVDDGHAIVYKPVAITILPPGGSLPRSDVNNDGRINVGDVQVVVNCILHTSVAAQYGLTGVITVQDVQGVVNCVLGIAPCP
jgi:hypothetical protein